MPSSLQTNFLDKILPHELIEISEWIQIRQFKQIDFNDNALL